MADEKKYCGSAKEKKFDNGGSIIEANVSFTTLLQPYIITGKDGKELLNLSDVKKDIADKKLLGFFTTQNGSVSIKVNLSQKKEVGKFGDTHAVYLNEYVAQPKPEGIKTPKQEPPKAEVAPLEDTDDLPF